MTNHIKGKTAFITGASSGIGKACAIILAQNGVNLILSARNRAKLKELKQDILSKCKIKINIFPLDITDKQDVHKKISHSLIKQNIDILINNAGLALGLEHIDKGDISQWEDMIDTNIKGVLYVSREIIPSMRKLSVAHIVNIGSVAGKTSYPNGAVYCATKSAVHSLGESMNADLFGTGVKVTTIAPGAVETNFSNIRFSGDKEKANSIYDGYTPLSADDVASAIFNVLNTPPHVNIQYLDIMPTAQRNPYMLYK
jgi:NADP-dependent 3-hydroxy acid dehydrogenase YdfG